MRNRFIPLRFGLFLFLVLVLTPQFVSTESPRIPTLFVYCDINNSFIENNLCESDNCSPKIFKGHYNYTYIHESRGRYISNSIMITNSRISFSGIHSYPLLYNFSDASGEFLKKSCKQDITPVLNYIKQNNFNYYNCAFYQNEIKFEGNIKQIDNWYLKCEFPYTYNPQQTNLIKYILIFIYSLFLSIILLLLFFIIMFTLIYFPITLFLLIGLVIILYYVGKKFDINRIYLLPLLIGFIGGLIGYFISDKNLKKRLLFLGLFVSLVSFLFYLLLF